MSLIQLYPWIITFQWSVVINNPGRSSTSSPLGQALTVIVAFLHHFQASSMSIPLLDYVYILDLRGILCSKGTLYMLM